MSGTTIGLTPATPPGIGLESTPHTARFTAYDAYERLLAGLGANPTQNAHRDIFRALNDATDEWGQVHDWNYFKTWLRIALHGSQTDGTIAYDHTGGAYERMVTLTGATWPEE